MSGQEVWTNTKFPSYIAGIAAALKYGYELGVLDDRAAKSATKATNALINFLTPDGLVTGTSQVNKGGEALQRSGYRLISPYTLGFMAYLISPVNPSVPNKQLYFFLQEQIGPEKYHAL